MAVTVNVRNRTPLTSGGPLKLNTEDRINEVDPRDTPMLRILGWSEDAPGNAAAMGANSLSFECFEKVHTWNNDELVPSESLLAANYTQTLAFTVTTGEGPFFLEDDVVAVVDDPSTITMYRVTDVTGDVLTVALLSASDNNADTGDKIIKYGNARIDGDVFDILGRQTTISQTQNFTQIFQKTTGVTGTEQAIEQFGIPRGTSFDRELSKTVQQLVMEFERAMVLGLRSTSLPATNVQPASRFGGAFYFLRDATGGAGAITQDAGGVDVTELVLNNTLETVWAAGGRPNLLVTSMTQARNMQMFIRPFLNAEFSQTQGGIVIGQYLSTNGVLDIVISRWLPHAGDMLVLDSSQLGFGPLAGRELSTTMLPQDGDYVRASILGEYTMEWMNNTTHHAWIYNLSTTAVT